MKEDNKTLHVAAGEAIEDFWSHQEKFEEAMSNLLYAIHAVEDLKAELDASWERLKEYKVYVTDHYNKIDQGCRYSNDICKRYEIWRKKGATHVTP